MPTNWPPSGAPTWPPPELGATTPTFADIRVFINRLRKQGFTQRAPTSAENTYFAGARCDHNHTVIGRMLISPSDVAYPVAVCSNASHRALLGYWNPLDAGARSGEE